MGEPDRADGDLEGEDSREQEALLQISKHGEMRQGLSWEQRTFREKAIYYADRIFLGFLFVFFLMLLAEFGYKMWYVMNASKPADLAVSLSDWLFAQERREL